MAFSSRDWPDHVRWAASETERMMRLLHRIVLVGLAAATLAAPVSSQKPDDQITSGGCSTSLRLRPALLGELPEAQERRSLG